ncbi:hypothetical protein F4810DRAFT_157940 [Camillea tinctor]|nr:hypothetical protein F4810DRAFT_157940 [Camillea tinctor]
MPPRPSILLRLPLRAGPGSLHPSSASPSSSRLFSRTAAACSTPNRIPPESPLFIHVPKPPQGQEIEARRELKPVKGFLPVPRRIFPKRTGHLKLKMRWIQRAAPTPTSPRRLCLVPRDEPKPKPKSRTEEGKALRRETEYQAYKRRMANLRRQHMHTGLLDLWARKHRFERRRAVRQAARRDAHRAAMLAPEREDERLTRPTVPASLLQTAVAPDPERFERALWSRERSVAHAARKSEARRDAIQQLYMNARGFIIAEEELEARVQELFADDYWRKMGSTAGGVSINNVWDLLGKPLSVAQMLADVTRSSGELMKNLDTEASRTLKRQKLVSEELTGGKME